MTGPSQKTTNDTQTTSVQSLVLNGRRYYFPYAHLFPPLAPEERESLKAAIAEQGIQNPVIVCRRGPNEFDVLDGKNRLEIAAELNLAHVPQNVQGDTLTKEQRYMLALTMNLARRHLTKEQRRHVVIELRKMGESYRSIAEKLKISEFTARADVKAATARNHAVDMPATIVGRDGKKRKAAEPEPTENEIAIARDLIAEVLPSWTKPVEAGWILREAKKRPGGLDLRYSVVVAALKRMVEAGTVIKIKNDQGHTAYHMAGDPAIRTTPQAGESLVPEKQPEEQLTELAPEQIKRAILEALANGPADLVEKRDKGWLSSVPPAKFWDCYVLELEKADAIRRLGITPNLNRVYELIPDTAAQSPSWLEKQAVKPAPEERDKTQTSKDAERIRELLKKHAPMPLRTTYIREQLNMTEERFTRARMLLYAESKITQNGESLWLLEAPVQEPETASGDEPPVNGQAVEAPGGDEQWLYKLFEAFIERADALRNALLDERIAVQQRTSDLLISRAEESLDILRGFVSLTEARQDGLVKLLEDILGRWREAEDD